MDEKICKRTIGFQGYSYNGMPIVADPNLPPGVIFTLDPEKIIFRDPPPDTRSRFKKFRDEVRRRISNAWYSLKGWEFD